MEELQHLDRFQTANYFAHIDSQLELAFELQKNFNQILEFSIQNLDEDSVKTLIRRSAGDSPVQRVYQVSLHNLVFI